MLRITVLGKRLASQSVKKYIPNRANGVSSGSGQPQEETPTAQHILFQVSP
jgi:hypothetical protein